MKKVQNPNDPSLEDVYDDAGNYVTTLPRDQANIEQVADPMTGMPVPSPEPATPEQQTNAEAIWSDPVKAATDGVRTGTTEVIARDGVRQGETTLEPGAADADPSTTPQGLVPLEPGAADRMDDAPMPMLGGDPGGLVERQRQTSGPSEESLTARRGDVENLAEQERGAALDEALAREMQLAEDEKRQLELERQVKEEQATNALKQKQVLARRQQVEERIATVAAQEPDRNRAFPSGWSAVATFIGAVAGGMLQGLQGGSNPVLDALYRRLDEDVKQQRLTQSEVLQDLTRQLGSIDAAEDMLRAKQKEVVLKETEARLLGSQNRVAPAQIDAFRKRMNAEIARHRIDALAKLERDLTIQEVNTPGSAPVPFNAETYRAESLKQMASQEGRDVKEVHKDWNTWNKGFQERATLRASLDTVGRALAKFEENGDVAGLGPLAKYIPNAVNTSDAKAVRQSLGFATAQYLKAVSGATVTEQEYARTVENLQGAGTYDDVRRGLNLLGQSVKSADEESSIQNPGFMRLRGELRSMNRRGSLADQPGRSQQQAAAGDVVQIPQTARIAYVHNNPGNLTYANQAGATRGEPKKGGGYWAKFESPGDGMRALARQVQLDQQRGLNVRQFVEKYAPADDGNRVEVYLDKIRRLTGADESVPLSEVSAGHLAFAIAAIESGARPAK